jgi:adenylate cyclase
MAADVLAVSSTMSWPTGEPVIVRVGVATGPAVAGVIGTRKFAYDVWGDTVNLASRLEEQAGAGQVLVSLRTAEWAGDRYGFGPVRIVDLEGKGPTPTQVLLGESEPSADGALAADRDTT